MGSETTTGISNGSDEKISFASDVNSEMHQNSGVCTK